MKSTTAFASSATNDHLFETNESSGVLIFTVDSNDPVHFKFSEKLRIQVVFDQPLSKSICDAYNEHDGFVSGLSLEKDTSCEAKLVEKNDSGVTQNSAKCNIYSEKDVKKQENSPISQTSKPQNYKNQEKNGIGYDEEHSHSLNIVSDLTPVDEMHVRSESTSNDEISRTKQKDKRFEKANDMGIIMKSDVEANKLLKDSIGYNSWIRQQPRRSTRSKTENKNVKTVHTKMKQKSIKSPVASTSKDDREIVGRNKKKKESTKTKKIKLVIRKKKCTKGQTKSIDHKLELEQDSDMTEDQGESDEEDTSLLSPEKRHCFFIAEDESCAKKIVNQSPKINIESEKKPPPKTLSEKNVHCKFCGVTFDTKLDFFNHRRMKGSSFTCKICGKEELFEGLLMVHMQTHKPNKGQLIEEENEHSKKLVKKKFRMKCDVCGLILSSLDCLKIHMMTHTGELPYKCCVCQDQRFFSLSSLSHHLQFHLSSERFQCKSCNMRFPSRAELAKHQLTHEIKCGLCGDIFPNKTSRNCHYRVAHQDDILRCTVCSGLFATEAELQKHMMYHTKGKREQCPVCGVVVMRLKDHMVRHTRRQEDKRYACHLCSARYLCKATLNKHLRTHTGEKPYKCDRCTKRFVSNGLLRKHLLTHTSERHFVCDVCGKRCTLRSNLVIHMRTHSNTRPYSCMFCSQAFNYKSSLRIHIKAKHSHQNQSTFTCPHCSEAFQDNTSLTSHILEEHSGAKINQNQEAVKHLPPPATSQQETAHMIMKPPPLTYISDHFQVYHHHTAEPNLHNAMHMTNTLDMSSMETTPSLLNRPTGDHMANSAVASTGFESVARRDLLNYLGRERHLPLGHSATSAVAMPPAALHPLPPLNSLNVDVQHANSNNVIAPPQPGVVPSNNNGLINANTPIGIKNLQLQDSTSLNEQAQYQLYPN